MSRFETEMRLRQNLMRELESVYESTRRAKIAHQRLMEFEAQAIDAPEMEQEPEQAHVNGCRCYECGDGYHPQD
jgi:hypothetical protein